MPSKTDWRLWLPPRKSLTPELRKRLGDLLASLPPHHVPPPRWMWPRLRDPKQWETIEIPLGGTQLKGRQEVVRLERWVLEILQLGAGEVPIRVLAHGDGKGRFYVIVSHPAINRMLSENGYSTNSALLAPMILTLVGLADVDGRTQFLDRNPFNLSIFNLTVRLFPRTPEGDEARRMRGAIFVARELLRRAEDAEAARWNRDGGCDAEG